MSSTTEKSGWLNVFKGQRCTSLAGHHLDFESEDYCLGQSSTTANPRLVWTSFWRKYVYIHDRICIRSTFRPTNRYCSERCGRNALFWDLLVLRVCPASVSLRGCPFLILVRGSRGKQQPLLLHIPIDPFARE